MDCQPTDKNYQEMRGDVIDLGCWTPDKSQGWRPTLRKGASQDSPCFRGLYMNEHDGRAYFTMLPICTLEPASDHWCWEPGYVNPKHKKDERRNIAPKAGKEREALEQLLLGR